MKEKKVPSSRRIGDIGECAVASFLRRRGYRILDRNFTVRGGEIDIIATRFRYIVFVEVKTRNALTDTEKYGRPADAVDAEKKTHLRHAAARYLALHSTKKKPRFDIAEVYLREREGKRRPAVAIRYHKEAF